MRGVSRATLNQGTGRITTAGSGIDGNTLLSVGGGQTQTLTAGQIPAISSSGSNTITVASTVGGIPFNAFISSTSGAGNTFPDTASVGTITSTGVNSIAVASTNTGGGAHPIMQPTTISGITLIRAA